MDVTIANYAPGGVTCAAGCTEAGSYTVCRSAGTAFAVSACQATCTAATMTGYSVGSASGDATIADFAPGAVTRAAGYTRAVSYTVCGSAGTAYSVSACQATCTTATTTAYSDGSASVDVTIADYAPGGVTCAAGYTEAGSHTVFQICWYCICGPSVPGNMHGSNGDWLQRWVCKRGHLRGARSERTWRSGASGSLGS